MTLKLFGAAILLLGFYYFILTRAISTKNYKRKSLWVFIAGLVIVLFLTGGIIYDAINNNFLYPNGKYDLAYFAFLIVAVVYMLTFTIIYLVKGIKLNQRFNNSFGGYKQVKVDKKPTVKEEKGFVYCIFKHNNNYLLQKDTENGNDVYKSLLVKFTHKDYFHDDVIRRIIDENKLDVDTFKLLGTATKPGSKDEVYYCYEVVINELTESLKGYEEFDSYQILNININDIDKKIIFTSIIEENFEIEI